MATAATQPAAAPNGAGVSADSADMASPQGITSDATLPTTTHTQLEVQLADDPTNLTAAEQLGLINLAETLPEGADWDSVLTDFRAAQDALRSGLTLDPAQLGQPENRWAIARRTSLDPDARQLFTMTYREQWLLSWSPNLPPHIAAAIQPYRQAVIARALRDHLVVLRDIVARIGWFDISRYGETASQAAWLIVQHADFDPAYQRAMLGNLRPRVARGDFQPRYFGYLIDRVAVNAGELQTYATQGRCVALPGGVSIWQPFDMIAPDAVDARRQSIGLEPLTAYRAHFTCEAPHG